jgi:amino acid transporter
MTTTVNPPTTPLMPADTALGVASFALVVWLGAHVIAAMALLVHTDGEQHPLAFYGWGVLASGLITSAFVYAGIAAFSELLDQARRTHRTTSQALLLLDEDS